MSKKKSQRMRLFLACFIILIGFSLSFPLLYCNLLIKSAVKIRPLQGSSASDSKVLVEGDVCKLLLLSGSERLLVGTEFLRHERDVVVQRQSLQTDNELRTADIILKQDSFTFFKSVIIMRHL